MAGTDVHDEWAAAEAPAEPPSLRVLLYSDHPDTREQVMLAVGRRISRDLPPVEWVPVATAAVALSTVEAGGLSLLILDGEASKTGGMALCRQIKDEIFQSPPVLVLIGRPQDAWLAASCQADAVVARPLDPILLQETVARMLRGSSVAR